MTEFEFENWIMTHLPAGRSPDELVDRLAIGSIAVIEASAVRLNRSVDDILEKFVWNDGHVTDFYS